MSGFDYSLLGRRVLCAVSGGADSVYLLHRCLEGAAENGFGVCAAHYNHCLRGEESRSGTRRFVAAMCARLGVDLRVGRGDVAGYAAAHGMGTEEAARTLRYDFPGAGGGRASRRRPSQRRTTPTTTRRRCSSPSRVEAARAASPAYRPGVAGSSGPCWA